jgi:bifunctional DNA-binding transcriptional regulator/antitoxin component of YhaV-PrlF toxin-antitoxin module
MVSIASVTHKNQITLPKSILEKAGIIGTAKVLVSTDGKTVVLSPLKSKVSELSGSLAYLAKGKTFNLKQIRQRTEELAAAQIVNEGQ